MRPATPVTPISLSRLGDTQAGRMMGFTRSTPRTAVSASALQRRRRLIAVAKRVLPLGAVALLAAIGMWPELSRDADHRRSQLQQSAGMTESGQMVDATYHSVDSQGRPYTVTAAHARQSRPGLINLTEPQADLTQQNGGWLMGKAKLGVYDQHAGSLDVWNDVQLYRDDGTTLATNSATIDLHASAAAGSEKVHVEGPFGTLDAQGFAATDRGAVTQFTGPGLLVLNAKSR